MVLIYCVYQNDNTFFLFSFFFPEQFTSSNMFPFLQLVFLRNGNTLFFMNLFVIVFTFLIVLRKWYLYFRTAYEWVNPASVGLVVVTSSEGRNLPYGRLEDILSRDASALNCHTNDDKRAWFAIDLGIWFLPTAYTLRHARGYGRSALRNWLFQVSVETILFFFHVRW